MTQGRSIHSVSWMEAVLSQSISRLTHLEDVHSTGELFFLHRQNKMLPCRVNMVLFLSNDRLAVLIRSASLIVSWKAWGASFMVCNSSQLMLICLFFGGHISWVTWPFRRGLQLNRLASVVMITLKCWPRSTPQTMETRTSPVKGHKQRCGDAGDVRL